MITPRATLRKLAAQEQRRLLAAELAALTWDGTPRLDAWLVTYAGAADTTAVRNIGAAWLRAVVGQVVTGGFDSGLTLILVGPQGCGKSLLLAALNGPRADLFVNLDDENPRGDLGRVFASALNSFPDYAEGSDLFLAVEVTRFDKERFTADRQQLLAEAVASFRAGGSVAP